MPTAPAWLQEGKFGIYTHWGAYCTLGRAVPSPHRNISWQAHYLYDQTNHYHQAAHALHIERFGPLAQFGYTDTFHLWTGEKFDPEEWADLAVQAGACFVGPVAEHHDGFSLWESKVNPVNAVNYGPRRDVVAALEKAYRARGLKFFCALHHAENRWFLHKVPGTDSELAQWENVFEKPHWTARRFHDFWWEKCREVIDGYSPDLLWFDFGLGAVPDTYKQCLCEYYYTHAAAQGQDVSICYKNKDLLPGQGLHDVELGGAPDIRLEPWITDTTVDLEESWGFLEEARYKTPGQIVRYLADNVSKNGFLLLNIGPKPDGTFPAEAVTILRGVGDWLRLNGEAIYGTHPWYTYGHGPTKYITGDTMTEHKNLCYTPQDVRYTAKGNCVYAILLGWPPEGRITLKGLYPLQEGEIASIELLGHEGALPYTVGSQKAVEVTLPEDPPCKHAFVLKILRHSAAP
jgi:alpha-L-fucosidase